jgi:hypothetical protein
VGVWLGDIKGKVGWIENYPSINLMSQKDYVSPLRMET